MTPSLRRLQAWLASFRLRTLFRAVFLLLALATLALALAVLREEKQQGYDNYQEGFAKTRDQIAARLRHPTGQLALLNPQSGGEAITPLRPLLLPYAALDVDEQAKVRNAVDMAGCSVQYPDDASLCVAVGASPRGGAFVYAVGRFAAPPLQAHATGERSLDGAHRLRIGLSARGQDYRWLAPVEFEANRPPVPGQALRARLSGFAEAPGGDYVNTRPQREFRGWIWQDDTCLAGRPEAPDCPREAFYAIRLPVEALRETRAGSSSPRWPPADLHEIRLQLQVFAPHATVPLFDSNSREARAPFLLADLQSLLLPGETLRIRKIDDSAPDLLHMVGNEASDEPLSPFLLNLIRRLPVERSAFPLVTHEEIATPAGRFALTLTGDARSAIRILAQAATRVAWLIGAMLLGIFLAWFAIELGIIRRIAVLTRRTRAAQTSASGAQGLDQLDVADLRSGDELGILASCLHDLQRRVREDMARDQIRAAQEKDMWHAVGHEIMSPLQSLLALHADPTDPDQRYLARMQQAIRVLYGSASPSEAFARTDLKLDALDLDAFLREVAQNAPAAGIARVDYRPAEGPVPVRADEFPLEDAVTHVLRNADRHRLPGSAITLWLGSDAHGVQFGIRNAGPQIAAGRLEKIFEYGVSGPEEARAASNRGQGLFVARTYMAKMGGTITARNTADGVEFVFALLRAE